jgi:ankyrin repeat protein
MIKKILVISFLSMTVISSTYAMESIHTEHCKNMKIETLCDATLAECYLCCKDLLNKGCDPHCFDNDLKQTALHIACTNEDLALVELLLSNGANFKEIDKDGNTPIDLIKYIVDTNIKEKMITLFNMVITTKNKN